MKALKNVVHLTLLAAWVLIGLGYTLQCLGAAGVVGLLHSGAFWLWLVGYAAVTSSLVGRFASVLAAPLVHAGVVLSLALLPAVAPLGWLRLGLDILGRR